MSAKKHDKKVLQARVVPGPPVSSTTAIIAGGPGYVGHRLGAPLWTPTLPELRIAARDSLRSPELYDVYVPTEPPATVSTPVARIGRSVAARSKGSKARALQDRAVLVRLDGAMAGQVHSLTEPEVSVGREVDCQVRLEGVGVSRMHARVLLREGTWWLQDLQSQNGSYVDGSRADMLQLSNDCIVGFGPVVSFRFQLLDQREEAALKRSFETSNRDALTGAHNRRYFEERLSLEIAFAIRGDSLLSVVVLDIDHFKQVNHAHGHIVGDTVLRHVAHTVRKELRREDVFARYAGEAFVFLLRDVDTLGASVVAERVRVVIETSPVQLEAQTVGVTASAGCASLDECLDPSVKELLLLAHRRVDAAKRAGRNRIAALC